MCRSSEVSTRVSAWAVGFEYADRCNIYISCVLLALQLIQHIRYVCRHTYVNNILTIQVRSSVLACAPGTRYCMPMHPQQSASRHITHTTPICWPHGRMGKGGRPECTQGNPNIAATASVRTLLYGDPAVLPGCCGGSHCEQGGSHSPQLALARHSCRAVLPRYP